MAPKSTTVPADAQAIAPGTAPPAACSTIAIPRSQPPMKVSSRSKVPWSPAQAANARHASSSLRKMALKLMAAPAAVQEHAAATAPPARSQAGVEFEEYVSYSILTFIHHIRCSNRSLFRITCDSNWQQLSRHRTHALHRASIDHYFMFVNIRVFPGFAQDLVDLLQIGALVQWISSHKVSSSECGRGW